MRKEPLGPEKEMDQRRLAVGLANTTRETLEETVSGEANPQMRSIQRRGIGEPQVESRPAPRGYHYITSRST
jgi:hypothetical protein